MLKLSQKLADASTRNRKRHDTAAGITMVEVILAVAIIGVLVGAFVVFITKIAQEQRYADNREAALNVTKKNMNQVLATPWSNLINSYAGGRLTTCNNQILFTGAPPANTDNGQKIGYVDTGASNTWSTWAWDSANSRYTVTRSSTSINQNTGILIHTLPPVAGTQVTWTGTINNTLTQSLTVSGLSGFSTGQTDTVPGGTQKNFTVTTQTNTGGGTVLNFAAANTAAGSFTVSNLKASTTFETTPAGLAKFWVGDATMTSGFNYVPSGTSPTWVWSPANSEYTITRIVSNSLNTGFRLTTPTAKAGQPVSWTVVVSNPAVGGTPAGTGSNLTVDGGAGYTVPNQTNNIVAPGALNQTVSVTTQTDATGVTVLNFGLPSGAAAGSFTVKGVVAAYPETVAQSGGQILNSIATGANISAGTAVYWVDGTPITCVNASTKTDLKKIVMTSQWYDGNTLKKMATATYRSRYASGS